MKKNTALIYLALVLSMVFWSFSYIWIKKVYVYLNPLTTVFLRLIISSIFLIVITLVMKKLQKPHRKDIPVILFLSFFQPFMYFLGESYGIQLVSPTVAAIMISTIPLFVPFSMYFLAKEPLMSNNFLGILISFLGVLMVVLNQDLTLAASPLGLMYMCIAVCSVMGYSVLLQRLLEKYNPYSLITYQNIVGIFYFLPLVLLIDYEDLTTIPYNTDLLLNLLALAVFASSMAYFLFMVGTKKVGVTKATLFTYLIPIFTALLSYIIFQEKFTVLKIVGIFITLAGLLLGKSPFQRKKLH
ncbi:MAG: DMT family transporter [Bacteroidales bacterium]|nr:DMT family transporter [Bacteroidales bacterium]MDD4214836.1 DMT family transporter [Bacteroidales bacterium]